MVLSAIFFLDLKGKVILSRNYRGDVAMEAADRFIPLLEHSGELASPVLLDTVHGCSHIYIRHANLYVLGLTRRNANVMAILVVLRRVCQVFTEYFRDLEEESLRDNFVLVYELLDEMMDFGMPQITETKVLQEYITQQSFQLEHVGKAPTAVTSAVSWRGEGIRYKKNEVFLDVVESVNLQVNSQGHVIHHEIVGAVKIRSMLSGMPELRLGLNDKVLFDQAASNANVSTSPAKMVELEDFRFHQCVKLNKFESERTISFVPPDGEFELLSYRVALKEQKPPIWVECIIETWSPSRIEYLIKVKSQLGKKQTANDVEVLVPVPEDADTPKFKTSSGHASFKPERSAILWTVGNIPPGREFTMRARLGRPSVKADDADEKDFSSLPIKVGFEVPYSTLSGLQVRYLKVTEKSGYAALPWVRYITQNGECAFRMPDHRSL